MDQKILNRINRVLALIEENAKQATPGPWGISHDHVIKHEKLEDGTYLSYDIACAPWHNTGYVYGVNPHKNSDMKYITTVEPKRMKQLVDDIRELLRELGYDSKVS